MATPHQLARLIDGVKDANDWSDYDLVRNAKEKGHVISKSNISRLRNPVVSIKGDVVRTLAAALRVTPAQVALAAIESMGIPLLQHDASTPEQAVRFDTSLSARDKESVLALLKHLRGSAASAGTPREARKGQEATSDKPKTVPTKEPLIGDYMGTSVAGKDVRENGADDGNQAQQL